MAFRRLKFFSPDTPSVDPRLDSAYNINSTKCVVTITPHPTFKSLLRADPSGIAGTKMVGLISDMSRSEFINISTHFDIGNSAPIFIPGKMSGQVGLNSNMMECVNLLGTIYETLLIAFSNKYGTRFENLKNRILSVPELTNTYFEDPSSEARQKDGGAVAVRPTADGVTVDEPERISEGALLMSLSDIRTRLKFGLSFIIFQTDQRITGGVDFGATVPDINGLETNSLILDNIPQAPDEKTISYTILSGVFLENCIINSYSTGINANSQISIPTESISVLYSSAKNIKSNIQIGEQ